MFYVFFLQFQARTCASNMYINILKKEKKVRIHIILFMSPFALNKSLWHENFEWEDIYYQSVPNMYHLLQENLFNSDCRLNGFEILSELFFFSYKRKQVSSQKQLG